MNVFAVTIQLASIFLTFLVIPNEGLLTRELKAQLLWTTGFISLAYVLNLLYKEKAQLKAYIWPILFLYIAFVSTLLSERVPVALFGGSFVRLGWLSYLSIICIEIVWVHNKASVTCLRAYGLLSALIVIGFLVDVSKILGGARLEAPFFQANSLALFIGIHLVLGLYLLFQKDHQRIRLRLVGIQLMSYSCLVLTQTRSTLIITTLLVVGWIFIKLPGVRQRLVWSLLSLAMLCLCVFTLQPKTTQRITDQEYFGQSTTYRLDLMKHGAKLLRLSPPLTGWGFDHLIYHFNIPKDLPEPLLDSYRHNYRIDSTHNIFLDRFLELGWIGGGLFLGIFMWGWYLSYRRRAWVIITLFTLIAGQYLIHVTIIEQELVTWGLILHELDVYYHRKNT